MQEQMEESIYPCLISITSALLAILFHSLGLSSLSGSQWDSLRLPVELGVGLNFKHPRQLGLMCRGFPTIKKKKTGMPVGHMRSARSASIKPKNKNIIRTQ